MAILTYDDAGTTWDAPSVTYDGATGVVTPPPTPAGGGAGLGNTLHSRPDSRRWTPPARPRPITPESRRRDEEEAIALMILLLED